MTYSDKLKDPRWQKKRLEILERDGWTCKECKNTERTLHVHHTNYWRNQEPWEYESHELTTLCEICHNEEHKRLEHQKRFITSIIRSYGGLSKDLNNIGWAMCPLDGKGEPIYDARFFSEMMLWLTSHKGMMIFIEEVYRDYLRFHSELCNDS